MRDVWRCRIIYSDLKRGNEVRVQIERDQGGAVGGLFFSPKSHKMS